MAGNGTALVAAQITPVQGAAIGWPCAMHPIDSADYSEPTESSWWLLYTKSRQEKMVADSLNAMGVQHYLPLIRRTSLSRGQRRVAEVPLFTGYVFVFGTNDDRVLALKTNRISTTQRVVDGERLQLDLRRIADLIDRGAPLTPEARLEPGQWVRVKCGPFVGMEGTVLKRRGKTRLLVAVDYLKQGASMEIDDFLLEPL
jgi:transcriptional antiterminator RfaH